MPKPASLPLWATSPPVGGIVEPTPGKKIVGFGPGERPPAQNVNWLYNLIGQWTQYVSDGDIQRGVKARHFPASSGYSGDMANYNYDSNGQVVLNGVVGSWEIPLIVNQGERITLISVLLVPAVGSNFTISFRKMDAAGVETAFTPPVTSSGTSRQTVSSAATTELVGSAMVNYQVTISGNAAGGRIESLTLFTDVPA